MGVGRGRVLAVSLYGRTVAYMKRYWVLFLLGLASVSFLGVMLLLSNAPRYEIPITEPQEQLLGTSDVLTSTTCKSEAHCRMLDVIDSAPSIGAEAALARYHELAEIHPELQSGCHYYYESIGRAVTLEKGLTEYREAGCQFGYLHGVLYAVGETYADSVDDLVDDLTSYCLGFIDDGSVSSPRSNCNHGIGHALAEVSQYDPILALEACGKLPTNTSNCADGVLMEFGDDHLKRVGFLVLSGATDDRETTSDPTTMRQICSKVPEYAEFVCYARVWKFTVTGPLETSPDMSAADLACSSAPSPRTKQGCYEGFGELVVNIPAPAISWPPASLSDADIKAQIVATHCTAMELPGSCLTGAISSMNSHLYAMDIDEEFVPNPCKFIEPSLVPVCDEAMDRARSLNWEQTAQQTVDQP